LTYYDLLNYIKFIVSNKLNFSSKEKTEESKSNEASQPSPIAISYKQLASKTYPPFSSLNDFPVFAFQDAASFNKTSKNFILKVINGIDSIKVFFDIPFLRYSLSSSC